MKNNQQKITKFTLGTLYFLIAILLVIISFFNIRNNPAMMNTLALATTVKPETFTEVYFEDHLKLPSHITQHKTYSFKFTIHNLENKDMEYPYEVYAEVNGEKILIDQKTVSIKNNEDKTIEEKFIISDPFTKLKITTNLINKNQEIAFWMEGETK